MKRFVLRPRPLLITINTALSDPTAAGLYHTDDQHIEILQSGDGPDQLGTLIHEVVHHAWHRVRGTQILKLLTLSRGLSEEVTDEQFTREVEELLVDAIAEEVGEIVLCNLGKIRVLLRAVGSGIV